MVPEPVRTALDRSRRHRRGAAPGADDDDKEWLGSYYSGINRELTDDERNRYAPPGAAKLYEAIKGKLIHRPKNADKLVPD